MLRFWLIFLAQGDQKCRKNDEKTSLTTNLFTSSYHQPTHDILFIFPVNGKLKRPFPMNGRAVFPALPAQFALLEGPHGQNPYCCIADLGDTVTRPRWREKTFRSDPTFTRASPGLAVAEQLPQIIIKIRRPHGEALERRTVRVRGGAASPRPTLLF